MCKRKRPQKYTRRKPVIARSDSDAAIHNPQAFAASLDRHAAIAARDDGVGYG